MFSGGRAVAFRQKSARVRIGMRICAAYKGAAKTRQCGPFAVK